MRVGGGARRARRRSPPPGSPSPPCRRSPIRCRTGPRTAPGTRGWTGPPVARRAGAGPAVARETVNGRGRPSGRPARGTRCASCRPSLRAGTPAPEPALLPIPASTPPPTPTPRPTRVPPRGPIGGGAQQYRAEFADVGGLGAGSEVTVAGVRVGRVLGVERATGPRGEVIAVVDFEVQRDSPVTSGARASVRYGDMLGIRYLSLDPTAEGRPAAGGPQELAPGQTLPLAATTPPVDLTALVNGFKPLFEAVEPEEVNALSRTVVSAFQGEPGAMDTLLGRL